MKYFKEIFLTEHAKQFRKYLIWKHEDGADYTYDDEKSDWHCVVSNNRLVAFLNKDRDYNETTFEEITEEELFAELL